MRRGWRKMYNEKLHCLQLSLHVIGIIKARKRNWLGMWIVWEKNLTGILRGNVNERGRLETPARVRRIILK